MIGITKNISPFGITLGVAMANLESIDLSKYNTDKDEDYLRRYLHHFGHLRRQPIHLLEIGVQSGASLYMWRDLFPRAQITGIDIKKVGIDDPSGRIRTYEAAQQDVAKLSAIAAEAAPNGFDVIVDDASHVGEYTLVSFDTLFATHLNPGGVYVLDDWSCAYRSDWPDGSEPVTVAGPHVLKRRKVSYRAYHLLRKQGGRFIRRLPVGDSARSTFRRAHVVVDRLGLSQQEFPSHSFGMAGVVKQLIDSCAVNGLHTRHGIDNISIYPSQVFISKVTLPRPEH